MRTPFVIAFVVVLLTAVLLAPSAAAVQIPESCPPVVRDPPIPGTVTLLFYTATDLMPGSGTRSTVQSAYYDVSNLRKTCEEQVWPF